MKTNLVDKAGHNWSLEGYSRMIINSTAHNTFNQVRLSTMSEFDVTLAAMSSHAASRPACAPIQGKVVNLVPESDKRFNSKYDTIYNHGYGDPAGTQGINCHHSLYPFIEGVSTNPFHHPNTKQAIENGNTQQKQRALERNVRRDKKLLEYAKKNGDQVGIVHYKSMLGNHRAKIRNLVDGHDFLHRDYSREKVATALSKLNESKIQIKNAQKQAKLDNIADKFGKAGFPRNLDEYRKVLYNKSDSRALRAYVSAREDGVVEPVVTYKDFISRTNELDNRIVGLVASDGTIITDYSNHMIARTFGTMHDKSHNDVKRKGVSINDISKDLRIGDIKRSRESKKFIGTNSHVVVNKNGSIITVVPRDSKRRRK